MLIADGKTVYYKECGSFESQQSSEESALAYVDLHNNYPNGLASTHSGVDALIYAFKKVVAQGEPSIWGHGCSYDGGNRDGTVRCVVGWLMDDEELAKYKSQGSWSGSLHSAMVEAGQEHLAGFKRGCVSLQAAQQIHDAAERAKSVIVPHTLINNLKRDGFRPTAEQEHELIQVVGLWQALSNR